MAGRVVEPSIRFKDGRFLQYRTPIGEKELGHYQLPPDDYSPAHADGSLLALSEDNRFATMVTRKSLYMLRLPSVDGASKDQP